MELLWHCCMLFQYPPQLQLEPHTQCRVLAQLLSCMSPLWGVLRLGLTTQQHLMPKWKERDGHSHKYQWLCGAGCLYLLTAKSDSTSCHLVGHTSFVSITNLSKLSTTPAYVHKTLTVLELNTLTPVTTGATGDAAKPQDSFISLVKIYQSHQWNWYKNLQRKPSHDRYGITS